MMLAATLTLLWACQEKENLVQLGLRYLARRQAADGSWESRGIPCDCPLEAPRPNPPLDAAARLPSKDDSPTK